MAELSNHDLHVTLIKMQGEISTNISEIRKDIQAILREQHGVSEWQDKHEEQDLISFRNLSNKLDGMNRYGASIAIIAGFVGAAASWLWGRIT